MTRSGMHGFTLIELIMVIVVLAIAAVALLSGYGQVADTIGTDATLQAGVQLARACGEYLIAERRDNPLKGYTGVTSGGSSICNVVPDPQGLTVTVTFTPYTAAACPAGTTCTLAGITVTQGSETLDTTSLMLASY